MERFTLEKYLKDPARRVVTRDGRPARIICTDRKSTDKYNIIALISHENYEKFATYNSEGCLYTNGASCNLDLFFAPIKQSRWVFLFKNRAGKIDVSYIHEDKSDAETDMNNSNGFALTEITWED